MIDVKTVVVSELATNCYVVTDEATGDCAVIDPGEFTPELDRVLSGAGYDRVKYILLTHGHCDHIGGAASVLEKTDGKAEVAVGDKDVPMLEDSFSNLSRFFLSAPLRTVRCNLALHDGDIIALGESIFKVLATPGHTGGSVCFICGDKIFSGDTLFYRSHGRTDFPTGSEKEIRESLNKIAELDGDYTVYPGHDMTTTLENERKFNPYIGSNFYDNIY